MTKRERKAAKGMNAATRWAHEQGHRRPAYQLFNGVYVCVSKGIPYVNPRNFA